MIELLILLLCLYISILMAQKIEHEKQSNLRKKTDK